jgi:hypothetical protein
MAPKRTKKGNPTSKTRDKYGFKRGKRDNKYPVFDVKSALSAIRLRHHSDDVSPSAVLRKVARSKFSDNPRVKKKLEKAREVDRKRRRNKK